MTVEQARKELERVSILKKRMDFLRLRLEHNTDYDANSLPVIKDDLAKVTKVYLKYLDKITKRLRDGELIKINDEKLLTLHYIDGYTYRQIGELIDKTTTNIKTQVFFAVERYAKSYDRAL